MSEISKIFDNKVKLTDKLLIIFISLIPLSLALSIFVADLLASISGVILIYMFLRRDFDLFKTIKKEIIFFSFFYLIILISLISTSYKSEAFLASFFYFRYFLLSMAIFYLLKKYDFFFKIFYKTIFLTFTLIIFDSLLQYLIGYNLFGYEKIVLEDGNINYLSGFFDEEKKLGSYLVRFLPLILSIIYFNKPKISIKLELIILLIIGIFVFLSSERVAFFLLVISYSFYFLVSNKKIFFLSFAIIIFVSLSTFQKTLTQKYLNFTLEQTGLYLLSNPSPRPINRDMIRYFSYDHENLSYTALVAFKKNYFFGGGVKSFYFSCAASIQKFQFKANKRNNRMICSTHPHNTYIQILSEIGVFGFIIVLFVFLKILLINCKIFLTKNKNNLIKSYFFINLSIIINIMPFIPSGNFFNNWISLMIFLPIGFWLYLHDKIKNNVY
jgi:O-antigen ligase